MCTIKIYKNSGYFILILMNAYENRWWVINPHIPMLPFHLPIRWRILKIKLREIPIILMHLSYNGPLIINMTKNNYGKI